MPEGRLLSAWRRGFSRWEADYRRFARIRGFETFNDWPYHRRGFLECWAEPGFHRFWRVWNPGIGYFVFRMYLGLGGRRHRVAATLLSFFACGLVHTLVVAPLLGRWSNTLLVTFACFGFLTLLSRSLAPILRQERWPAVVNILVNVGLILGSFDLGFRVNDLL